MNKFIGLGRITKDIEIKYNSNNKAVCQFTLAINRPFTNQNGEREADFINCVVWDKQAENLVKYCSKGSQIAIEGRLQVRNYDDKEGRKVYITEIVASKVEFIQSLEKKEQVKESPQETTDPFKEFGQEYELSNEDLPF